jgi:hypothetical protein
VRPPVPDAFGDVQRAADVELLLRRLARDSGADSVIGVVVEFVDVDQAISA